MKVNYVIVTSEVYPFNYSTEKARGIANLAKALNARGLNVSVITPYYGTRTNQSYKYERVESNLYFKKENGISYYFTINENFLKLNDENDEHKRTEYFFDFSIQAAGACKSQNLKPIIIDIHDHHAGLMPVYIRDQYNYYSTFAICKFIFTIHDVYSAGNSYRRTIKDALNLNAYNDASLEKLDQDVVLINNCIDLADYIQIIGKRNYEELFKARISVDTIKKLKSKKKQIGFYDNFLDYDLYNPEKDVNITYSYSAFKYRDKIENKEYFGNKYRSQFRLDANDNKPYYVFEGEFVENYNFKELISVISKFLKHNDAKFFFFGHGPKKLEDLVADLEEKYPRRVIFKLNINNALRREVLGAADYMLFTNPQNNKGIEHMMAMRYGVVPICIDSGVYSYQLEHYNYDKNKGEVIKYKSNTAKAFMQALNYSMMIYKDSYSYYNLVATCMQKDMNIESRIQPSIDQYKKLIDVIRKEYNKAK